MLIKLADSVYPDSPVRTANRFVDLTRVPCVGEEIMILLEDDEDFYTVYKVTKTTHLVTYGREGEPVAICEVRR